MNEVLSGQESDKAERFKINLNKVTTNETSSKYHTLEKNSYDY